MQLGQCNLWSQLILSKKHQVFFVENLNLGLFGGLSYKIYTCYLLLNTQLDNGSICDAPHAHYA